MLFKGQGKGLAVLAILLGMSVSAKAGDVVYASLGDTNTALVKFGEVAGQPTNSASLPWINLSKKRIGEINKRK